MKPWPLVLIAVSLWVDVGLRSHGPASSGPGGGSPSEGISPGWKAAAEQASGRIRVVTLFGDPAAWPDKVAKAAKGLGPKDALVCRIRSLGGDVRSALKVSRLLRKASFLVVTLAEGPAVGASSLVVLSGRVVAVTEKARIGAADSAQFQSGSLDPKVTARLVGEYEALARARGLPAGLLAAMVDSTRHFDVGRGLPAKVREGLTDEDRETLSSVRKGRLLQLGSRLALALRVADLSVQDLKDLFLRFGWEGRRYEEDGLVHAPVAEQRPETQVGKKRDPVALVSGAKRVFVVEVHGTIDLGLAPFLVRILKHRKPTDVVILDVDTFGGRVDAAVKIRDALLATKAKTIAFIDRRAISAGSLISLACDIIAVTPGSSIGAATPVQLSGGKMKPTEEKVVSYMRKEMKSTAEAKGRRGDIAEAMVDREVEVRDVDPELKRRIEGLNKGKLLTLTDKEALELGMADLQASSIQDLKAKLKLTGLPERRPKVNWAEKIARFLTDPIVSSLLLTLGLLGILLELYTPGLGLAGLFGVTCLVLFFFGHMIADLAGWGHVLLFGLGVILLTIEVFVTPGFGFLGGAGIFLIVVSLVWSLSGLRSVPWKVAWNLGYVTRGLAMVLGSVAATAVLGFVAVRFLPKAKFLRPLILATPSAEEGLVPSPEDGRSGPKEGELGRAVTLLRPSGKVRFGRDVYPAVARGEFVARGGTVRFLGWEGSRALVAAVPPETRDASGNGSLGPEGRGPEERRTAGQAGPPEGGSSDAGKPGPGERDT